MIFAIIIYMIIIAPMIRPRPAPLPSRHASLDESPGFLLWQVSNLWQRRQRAALAPLELTHVQYALLSGALHLARAGGPPSQARLAAHAHADVMMTSTVVRSLEARDLVRREEDPADTRAWLVVVTPAGRALAERAQAASEAADAAFFAALGDRLRGFTSALRGLARYPGTVARPGPAGVGDLFARAAAADQLTPWFKDHATASRHRQACGGWLFPFRHQFFVSGDDAIVALGLSPDDADLALVGRDLSRPDDPAAFERLAARVC
jgi:DNA-binding MarR family transcriptional regulator